MRSSLGTLRLLLKHILLLIFVFAVCRILFFVFNHSCFTDVGFVELLRLLFVGLRFDLSIIFLFNFLFILLYFLPLPFREGAIYRLVTKWLFVVVNGFLVLANCIDFAYFQFTLKRTNATVFNFFSGKIGNDLISLLPVFIKDYWYVPIIWILLCLMLYFLYSKIEKEEVRLHWDRTQYKRQLLLFLVVIALSVLGYRGGVQLKPISVVTAGEYVTAKYIPLVINTPFSIVKTLDVAAIEPSEKWHIDEQVAMGLYKTKHVGSKQAFKPMNVVVVALESFSKEYIGALNGERNGFTPFLDSLISVSYTCCNAFANGKTSIEGIPSIVAGIPTWMNEPYITSPYGSNQLQSMANLLKPMGYYTAFFHGGTNGTMGFDAFAKIAGFDDYFGRKEYNNEQDYDGNWGIWDEEFLNYTGGVLSKKKEPFFATVFTLTSHHPYNVPAKYENTFKEGDLPVHKSIAYTDFALRQFFESVKKMEWFKNTLFVLAADHTGISSDLYYSNPVGNYEIPIIYYAPGADLRHSDSTLTQQIDILPSVLDFLHYPNSYFALGNSVFDTLSERFALTHNGGLYQLIQNDYDLQFDGDHVNALYRYSNDSLLKNNLLGLDTIVESKMEQKMKAIIQTYQQALISDKMRY